MQSLKGFFHSVIDRFYGEKQVIEKSFLVPEDSRGSGVKEGENDQPKKEEAKLPPF